MPSVHLRYLAPTTVSVTASAALANDNRAARCGCRQRALDAYNEYEQLHSTQARLLDEKTHSRQ